MKKCKIRDGIPKDMQVIDSQFILILHDTGIALLIPYTLYKLNKNRVELLVKCAEECIQKYFLNL